jgi:ribonuclease BN (tRNA processing enzyme)
MKVTVVGSGDAFGTGGRSNTCFRVDSNVGTVLVDFGASALVSWNRLGMSTLDIGAVVISHLHGDHFGGLPFLLLESQFVSERRKPLILAGPPGLHTRLEMACEVLFPGMTGNRWSFPWHVLEITPGSTEKIAGFDVKTLEVRHPSGAPATGIRVSDGEKLFAYSGDTSWMANVPVIADGADLFMCECYAAEHPIPNHIDWSNLKLQLPNLKARQIAVTHLGRKALAHVAEIAAAGLAIAEDGKVFDL